MHFIVQTLSRFPLRALYGMSDAIFFVAHRMMRWRYDVAASNLQRAFPGMTSPQRGAILEQSYRNLADLVVEILWGAAASRAQIADRVRVDNPECVNDELRAGRSVLLLTAHFCNWEWQVLAGNLLLDKPMYAVYKPQRIAALDRFLHATRSRFGHAPIPHKALTQFLLNHRREANVYAMVADQTPTRDEPSHRTTFLEQDTEFFVGADTIARLLRASVFFVEMRRVSRGRYVMRLSRLAEPPYAKRASTDIVERYTRALERQIRTSPADWLWVHRKWKEPLQAGAESRPGPAPVGLRSRPLPRKVDA